MNLGLILVIDIFFLLSICCFVYKISNEFQWIHTRKMFENQQNKMAFMCATYKFTHTQTYTYREQEDLICMYVGILCMYLRIYALEFSISWIHENICLGVHTQSKRIQHKHFLKINLTFTASDGCGEKGVLGGVYSHKSWYFQVYALYTIFGNSYHYFWKNTHTYTQAYNLNFDKNKNCTLKAGSVYKTYSVTK